MVDYQRPTHIQSLIVGLVSHVSAHNASSVASYIV